MQLKSKGKFIKQMAFFISLPIYLVSTNSLAQTNIVNITFQGTEAKKLFSYLTGPKVHADAGMSKQYLQGINIVCQYVTASITSNGVNVPMGDPSRYSCTSNFDYNGLAASTTLP